jgi:transcriptional regulator with XRE-family HTH domain
VVTGTSKRAGTADVSQRFADRARELRRNRGWTAQHLADRITAAGYAVSRSMIAYQETKPLRITLDQAAATARAFGVSLAVLIDDAPCPTCEDKPPTGFTCNGCGTTTKKTGV